MLIDFNSQIAKLVNLGKQKVLMEIQSDIAKDELTKAYQVSGLAQNMINELVEEFDKIGDSNEN